MVLDRELSRMMAAAAKSATVASIAAGYSRGHKVTRDSAWTASAEVFKRERPTEGLSLPTPVPEYDHEQDPWSKRADVEG